MSVDFAAKIEKDNRINEFKNNIHHFVKQLKSNPELINDLNDEEINILYQFRNPYVKKLPLGDKNDNVYNCISFTNSPDKWYEKLHTTTMVGFLYRRLHEYEIEEDDIKTTIDNKQFLEEHIPNTKDNFDIYKQKHYTDIKYQVIKEKYDIVLNSRETTEEVTSEEMDKDNNVIHAYELTLDELVELDHKLNDYVQDNYYKPIIKLNREKRSNYIDALIKNQSDEEKVIIERFLNSIFNFNPDKHVRQSYKFEPNENKYENYKENVLTPINKEIKEDLENIKKHIPSDNVFYNYNQYYEHSYEIMRVATENIYKLSPLIELAFNIYAQYNSPEECKEFVEKYQHLVKNDISIVQNNSWRLVLNGFAENKKVNEIVDKQNIFLQNMLKQHEKDTKIKEEILNKQVEVKKIKNIKRMGKKDNAMKNYEGLDDGYMRRSGAQSLNIDTDNITSEIDDIENQLVSEYGAPLDEDGIPEDCIAVEVFHSNPNQNTFETSRIFSKSQQLDSELSKIADEDKLADFNKKRALNM